MTDNTDSTIDVDLTSDQPQPVTDPDPDPDPATDADESFEDRVESEVRRYLMNSESVEDALAELQQEKQQAIEQYRQLAKQRQQKANYRSELATSKDIIKRQPASGMVERELAGGIFAEVVPDDEAADGEYSREDLLEEIDDKRDELDDAIETLDQRIEKTEDVAKVAHAAHQSIKADAEQHQQQRQQSNASASGTDQFNLNL